MKNKIKWKHLKFVPEAAVPDTKGICFGDQGFLYLCNELYEGRSPYGYTIRDTKFRPGEGGSNVSFDFTGLREALWKDQYKNPRKPSIFVRYSTAIGYERLVEARRRMLWAAIREYDTPGELAMDILALLAHGPPEEIEAFILSVYRRQEVFMFAPPLYSRPV